MAKQTTLRTKLAIRFALLSLLISLALGATLYFYFRIQIRQQLKQHLRDVVGMTAVQVSGDEHALIQPGDNEKSASYGHIASAFQSIHMTGSTIADVYTMRLNENGEIIFVIDTDEEDPAAVGEVYSDPGPVLAANFATMNEPLVENDFYTDQWGTWLSGYAPIYRSNGEREAVLAVDVSAESVIARERQLLWIVLLISLAATTIATGLGWWWAHRITQPLLQMVAMAASISDDHLTALAQSMAGVAQGDLSQSFRLSASSLEITSTDEVGRLGRSFNQILTRLQEISNSFGQMVMQLRESMGRIAENAESLRIASIQLASAAAESGQATSQIFTTIQQVALGATQQSQEVRHTSSAVEQVDHAIEGVARGAQEQAKAIHTAAEVTSHINMAVTQVTTNAESGARGAMEAAGAALAGAKTVEAAIASMQMIRQNAEIAAHKIKEMGKRSEQIDSIIETIDSIASQTDLLALNAAIEAARVESKGEKTVENILQQHMLGAVNLIADMLAFGRELDSRDLVGLAQQARVDSFSITDPDGVIVCTNQSDSLGFRFSEDPRQESSVFRCLLNQREGVVLRPVRDRDQDSKPYIYVGVSRRDRSGIVQAGMSGDIVYRLGGYSRGFAVVSEEIRKLAERAKESTKEIATLISGIQKTVKETIGIVEEGTHEMENGSTRATEAGHSLAAILSSSETVRQQVEEIVEAVQHMSQSSKELINVMETVNGVVKGNSVATQELACGSREVTQAIENIASVSEENSAAVEEVSASAEEMSAQVEEVTASAQCLAEMAQALQQVVSQFKLSNERGG